jgi:hypothetical protein
MHVGGFSNARWRLIGRMLEAFRTHVGGFPDIRQDLIVAVSVV